MKSSGAIGVMIIIISFLGVTLLSSVNITPINKETIDYELKTENLFKNQPIQDYVIPHSKTTGLAYLYNKCKEPGFKDYPENQVFTKTEVTPLKTILDSLNYSKNCKLITIDLNLKTDESPDHIIKYPLMPILCQWPNKEATLSTIGFNNPDNLHTITFDYKPGESVIYLKNFDKNSDEFYDLYDEIIYTGSGGINLPIDTLFIGHHFLYVMYSDGVASYPNLEINVNQSDYIIKCCEKEIINNQIPNFIIDLEETQPSLYSNIYSGEYSYKVNLSNFTKYGDELTINALTYKITNNQIILEKPYDLKNIDILYENKNCILKLNDIDKTIDLGTTCNYKITGSGDWEFESQFYEGSHTSEIIGHKLNMNPFALFNINSSFIIAFIGTVIILSGLCALSVGLNFIDWAVIISIIAFILVVW